MRLLLASLVLVAAAVAVSAQQYNNNNNYYPPPQNNYNNYPPQNNYNNYAAPPPQPYNNNYNNKYNNQPYCKHETLGCSVADVNILGGGPNFLLSENYQFQSVNMTNYFCSAFCAGNWYSHSFTFNGTGCYCGVLLNFVPSKDCNSICAGNSREVCGAATATGSLAVPVTMSSTSFNCPEKITEVTAKYYPETCQSKVLQCSFMNDTLFNYESGATALNIPNLRNDGCAALCSIIAAYDEFDFKSVNSWGFTLSGTSNGTNCFCVVAPGPAYPEHKCHSRCSGNYQEKCGGPDGYATISTTQIGCPLQSVFRQLKHYHHSYYSKYSTPY